MASKTAAVGRTTEVSIVRKGNVGAFFESCNCRVAKYYKLVLCSSNSDTL